MFDENDILVEASTAGLSYGHQLIIDTRGDFLTGVNQDTSASLPELEEVELQDLLQKSPRKVADTIEWFNLVTEQYRRGELTLGEAAELVGSTRYAYDARLKELGIAQEQPSKTSEEIEASQFLIRKMRNL